MNRNMKPITDQDGETVATFDLAVAENIASSKRHNDTRWVTLYRTASERYVIEHFTCWQGEHVYYTMADIQEASRFVARWSDVDDAPADLREALHALEV